MEQHLTYDSEDILGMLGIEQMETDTNVKFAEVNLMFLQDQTQWSRHNLKPVKIVENHDRLLQRVAMQ